MCAGDRGLSAGGSSNNICVAFLTLTLGERGINGGFNVSFGGEPPDVLRRPLNGDPGRCFLCSCMTEEGDMRPLLFVRRGEEEATIF